MRLHKLLFIKAMSIEDHTKIKDACKQYKLPYTKYHNNKNLYVFDLCTSDHLDIQRLLIELGEVSPINLSLIKEGFSYNTKTSKKIFI